MSPHLHLIFYQFHFFLKCVQISLSIGPSQCIIISFETNMIGLNCCEFGC